MIHESLKQPVCEVADMKYNRVQFYRATGDTSKPYLQPGHKLYSEDYVRDLKSKITILEEQIDDMWMEERVRGEWDE